MSDRNVNININGKDNASHVLQSVGKSTDMLSRQLGGLKKAFGAIIGLQIIREVVNDLMETAEMMDEVGKSSDKLGIATESFLSLKWAADQSGVSFESLDKSLVKMSRNMSEAASGGGKAVADSLKDIGLTAKELMQLSPEEQFSRIADGLNALPSEADRIRVAMDIFGKSGADLIPLLAEGSEGLKAFREEAEQMGIIFSREDAARMEEMNDQINKMTTSLGSLKIALLNMSAPTVTAGAKIVTDMLNGTDSAESRAFWAIASLRIGAVADVRNHPDLQNDLNAGAYSPEQAAIDAAAALQKQAAFDASKQGQQSTAAAAERKRIGAYFGFGETKAAGEGDFKNIRENLLGAMGGVQSLFGSVAKTGQDIGTGLVKGIEVGWDASKQRLKDRLEDLTMSLRTPIEIYRDGLKELDDLGGRGLDPETANRRRAALLQEFGASLSQGGGPTQLAAREFRALTRAPGASSPEIEAAKQQNKTLTAIKAVADKQLKELTEMAKDTKAIREQVPAEADF